MVRYAESEFCVCLTVIVSINFTIASQIASMRFPSLRTLVPRRRLWNVYCCMRQVSQIMVSSSIIPTSTDINFSFNLACQHNTRAPNHATPQQHALKPRPVSRSSLSPVPAASSAPLSHAPKEIQPPSSNALVNARSRNAMRDLQTLLASVPRSARVYRPRSLTTMTW